MREYQSPFITKGAKSIKVALEKFRFESTLQPEQYHKGINDHFITVQSVKWVEYSFSTSS